MICIETDNEVLAMDESDYCDLVAQAYDEAANVPDLPGPNYVDEYGGRQNVSECTESDGNVFKGVVYAVLFLCAARCLWCLAVAVWRML
jgi:hypothetical protein